MPSPRLHRLAQFVLALILVIPSVSWVGPEPLARTTTESLPNEDQDDGREIELASPTSRQALNTERPALDSNRPTPAAPVSGARVVRDNVSTRHTPTDPLCARLRC